VHSGGNPSLLGVRFPGIVRAAGVRPQVMSSRSMQPTALRAFADAGRWTKTRSAEWITQDEVP
jgi:hypothetical protein